MEPVECDRFVVALHYVYGSALLGRHETMVRQPWRRESYSTAARVVLEEANNSANSGAPVSQSHVV